MIVLKKIFDFYIKSSLHLGICVVSLYCVGIIKQKLDFSFLLIIFLFCSTIIVYNSIKYSSINKYYFETKKSIINNIQLLSFSCLIILLFSLFFLKFETILFAILLFFICLLYAFPLGLSNSNLRNVGKVKLFLVAVCWSASTIILPAIENEIQNIYQTIILTIQFFILVIIYTIPFEIRDMEHDSKDLKTIPQLMGIKNSKRLAYLLIAVFYVLSIENFSINFLKESDLLISILLILIIYLTKKNQSKYFASFWVESVPIYWILISLILN